MCRARRAFVPPPSGRTVSLRLDHRERDRSGAHDRGIGLDPALLVDHDSGRPVRRVRRLEEVGLAGEGDRHGPGDVVLERRHPGSEDDEVGPAGVPSDDDGRCVRQAQRFARMDDDRVDEASGLGDRNAPLRALVRSDELLRAVSGECEALVRHPLEDRSGRPHPPRVPGGVEHQVLRRSRLDGLDESQVHAPLPETELLLPGVEYTGLRRDLARAGGKGDRGGEDEQQKAAGRHGKWAVVAHSTSRRRRILSKRRNPLCRDGRDG